MRWPLARAEFRLRAMMVVLAICASVFAGRLVEVQALDTQAYAEKAASRFTSTVELPAERGVLTDSQGTLLATTEDAVMITADPTLVAEDAGVIIDVLAKYIDDPDPEAYRAALTKPDTRYSVIARKVPVATYVKIADELNSLGVYGIFRQTDPIRLYPEGETAAAVLGFVNSEGEGAAGFEMAADENLSGTPGTESYESSSGYRIPLGRNVVEPAVNGVSYELTLDAAIQSATERRLQQAMEENGASSASAVVMNVKTGEIVALANTPGFDPNSPSQANPDDMFNRAVTYAYEPGSTGKVLTMAAAIDSSTISSETRLQIPGSIEAGGSTVTDHWDHGLINLTARGALVKSSNVGMIMINRKLEDGVLRDYMKDFGIGQKTGVEVPGEATGLLPDEETFDSASGDRIAFGQAYSTTAVQMAAAVAGVVNGGVYNPPTLVRSATGPDGQPVEVDHGESRQVVSEETSEAVVDMMTSVVGPETNTWLAAVDGYNTAGKTGTAQKFNTETQKYDSFTTSFVGVAPAEDPTLLTYVVMQDAEGSGTSDAAPPFRDIMEYALPRYGIPPSTKKADYPAIDW
ncbi:peptidoglycan D,D-transpeptidase FtsI family protein [Naumannella halotolerans]|uniref:peptidoglycan D,D-transpeptidase FtsI family protein n=1 Tax=Naumannella halotolerans TaxID=993414 RepID=UPI001414D37A|nr:penicillin-binding protein 2 [Naumannella halotolerans]